jgi:hypothetical protein
LFAILPLPIFQLYVQQASHQQRNRYFGKPAEIILHLRRPPSAVFPCEFFAADFDFSLYVGRYGIGWRMIHNTAPKAARESVGPARIITESIPSPPATESIRKCAPKIIGSAGAIHMQI